MSFIADNIVRITREPYWMEYYLYKPLLDQ